MDQLVSGLDPNVIVGLCTIRKSLVWHPDLVLSALLKDHSDNDSECSSCDGSKGPDDGSEMSADD